MSRYFTSHANPKTRRAFELADDAHRGVFRKYSALPYITHPVGVARMLEHLGADQEMVQAGLLHDVLEMASDRYSLESLASDLGKGVSDPVVELTDVSRPEDGLRNARKALDRHHVAGASSRAKSIKLMDIAHNMPSIARHAGVFARVWLDEKSLQVETLSDASLPKAFSLVSRQLIRARSRICALDGTIW